MAGKRSVKFPVTCNPRTYFLAVSRSIYSNRVISVLSVCQSRFMLQKFRYPCDPRKHYLIPSYLVFFSVIWKLKW